MTKLYNIPSMTKRRKMLRRSSPPAEIILWQYLKRKQLGGYKFRRQYSIGGYVVDFYCPRLRLVIEVDGPSHFINNEAVKNDQERQAFIESFNIKFVRISNNDIYNNLEGVINKLLSVIQEK